MGAFKIIPNHKLIAYAKHIKGDDIYIVYAINAKTNEFIGKPLIGTLYYQVSDPKQQRGKSMPSLDLQFVVFSSNKFMNMCKGSQFKKQYSALRGAA